MSWFIHPLLQFENCSSKKSQIFRPPLIIRIIKIFKNSSTYFSTLSFPYFHDWHWVTMPLGRSVPIFGQLFCSYDFPEWNPLILQNSSKSKLVTPTFTISIELTISFGSSVSSCVELRFYLLSNIRTELGPEIPVLKASYDAFPYDKDWIRLKPEPDGRRRATHSE